MIQFRRIDHITISVPADQLELARDFYSNKLELSPKPAPEALRVRGFFWYDVAGLEIHIGPEDNFHPSDRHPAFEVENLTDIRANLEAKGVRIKDTVKLPDRERFFVYDPFGNRIELIEYAERR